MPTRIKCAFKRYRHTAKGRYTRHKVNAARRGIPFLLTFEQWRQVWQAAGKWKSDLRGPVSKWYVMCRLKDAGAYEQGNVYIGTKRQNCKDMNMYARKK
jgi:hypothetical protein